MVESRRVSVLKPRLIPDFSNLVLKLFPLAMGKVSWIFKPNSFVPPRPAHARIKSLPPIQHTVAW